MRLVLIEPRTMSIMEVERTNNKERSPMKMILYVALLLSASINFQAYAYVSGKAAITEKKIYCPEKITCTKDGDFSSCKYNSDTPQYWNSVRGSIALTDYPYIFSNVRSSYHITDFQTLCIYKQKETSEKITLDAKFESNLEPYYDKTTKWDEGFGTVSCQSDTPSSCPLKEASGIGISFNNLGKIDVFKTFSFSAHNVKFGGSGGQTYEFIQYDNAVSCWSDKECKIDIEMNNNDIGSILIGSIVVDMDNKMKILKVLPISSSGMDIKKIEPFNTIEIKKSDNPPSRPSLEIDNFTNYEISISVNDTVITKIVARQGHGNLFAYRAAEKCANLKECKVNITNPFGGLIGSVIVDVENNMNILSIQSTRASEIVINQIDDHKVEIRYPNKSH